jgi:polyhydroxyalkanoate synthase subunit PhaE
MLRCSIIERTLAALSGGCMQNEFLGAMQSGAEQYLKGLNELSEKFMGSNAMSGQGPSWSEGMEQFAKLYAGGNSHEGVFDQLMSQGKGFVAMLEKMYQAGGQSTGGNIDFASLGQQMLGELAKNNPFTQIPGLQMPGLQLPGTNAGMGFPGMSGMNFTMPTFPVFDAKTFSVENFLNMPAFGSNRESQERKTSLIKHMGSYMQALQGYQALQMKSIQMAIERMQGKLEERSEPGRGLDSMKAVYDLWIDALEESFAEVALTKDYQSAYGQVVDAQMRVRANVQKQIELATGEIGMPTRSELEGVHQKLAEVRRSMRTELAGLKAEIAELKSARAPAAKPAAAPSAVKVSAKAASPNKIVKAVPTGLLSAAKAMAAKAPTAKAIPKPAAQLAAAKSTAPARKK